MDWQIFTATFFTIFIAEMGDKTQIAAFAAATQTSSLISVLGATVLALVMAGTLGVIGGSLLGQMISPQKLRYLSGFLFIGMGCWILLKK